MSELKRCPFCGITLIADGNKFFVHPVVGCLLDGIPIKNDAESIKRWNTRKPLKRIVERLEENRDDFMDYIYEELREDADNCRANRIIDRFDEVTEIVKEEGGMNET